MIKEYIMVLTVIRKRLLDIHGRLTFSLQWTTIGHSKSKEPLTHPVAVRRPLLFLVLKFHVGGPLVFLNL